MMNARELIDALSKVDPSTPIMITTSYDGGDSLVTRFDANLNAVVVEDDTYPKMTFYREISSDELAENPEGIDGMFNAFTLIANKY